MRPAAQHGFSIVSAIFILVVLAALGAFIVNISTTQQIGSALDIQGARAYQAARSGLEWGIYQVQATAAYRFGYTALGVATDPNVRSCATASGSFTFPATATTLAGFSVSVDCQSTPANDALSTPVVVRIIATACNQPNASVPYCPNVTNPSSFYVERRLEVSF